MNVLMISGDISAVKNEKGPFSETLNGLALLYTQIYIFCPEVYSDIDRNFLPNVKLRSRKRRMLFKAIFYQEILTFIKDIKIDLIVSHDYGLMLNGINASIIAQKINVPHISEIFHLEGHPNPCNLKERIFSRWGKTYIHLIKKRVALFRVMNYQIIENLFLKLKVDPKKIANINAIYINKKYYYPQVIQKEFDFIFCGRFSSNKGIDLFLTSIKELKNYFPQVKTAMIGSGPLWNFANNYIKKNSLEKNIKLILRVPSENELAMYYAQSKFLVCASSVEGGPRVTIEALACGTPIITTPVGVMPEIIKNGVNGQLIGPSKNELLFQMKKYLKIHPNEYQKLVKATQDGLERFDAANSMENIFNNYRKVVDYHLLQIIN